jgi:hypothetical protein
MRNGVIGNIAKNENICSNYLLTLFSTLVISSSVTPS